MKVQRVDYNNRAKRLELKTHKGVYYFPYVQLHPAPSARNHLVNVWVDPELGREGVTYSLEDGQEGSLLLDQVLYFNQEPRYMRELLTRRASAIAAKLLEQSPLPHREIARQLQTSPEQVYRLVDPNRTGQHLENILTLIHVLDAEVELRIRTKSGGFKETMKVPVRQQATDTSR